MPDYDSRPFSSSLSFHPFLPSLSTQHKHTTVHHFSNFSCQYHELLPCFSFCYIQPWIDVPAFSALVQCWVLLGKTTVLQVGATAYSSWSPTSAAPSLLPHILSALCQFFLPFLRVAKAFTLSDINSPLPSLSTSVLTVFYKKNRSHCPGSPLFLPLSQQPSLPSVITSCAPVILKFISFLLSD